MDSTSWLCRFLLSQRLKVGIVLNVVRVFPKLAQSNWNPKLLPPSVVLMTFVLIHSLETKTVYLGSQIK